MWRKPSTKAAAKALLFVGVWTLIGLAFASQFNFTQSRRGYVVTWPFALQTALADWYVFAVLSIPALWLARRYRLGGPSWKGPLAVHLLAGAVFAVAWVVLRVWVEQVRLASRVPWFDFGEMFHWTLARSFYFNLLVYWIIVGASHAFSLYRELQDRELRAMELEKLLVQSRLETLQAQLNPHFLFNTLHAISALMHTDVEAADRMISRLSDLLRMALERTDTQEVPLRREVDFLQKYLDIEQIRFGPRLQVELDIEPEVWEALVPSLILQPLVENAIRHGLEPRARAGRIVVSARQADGRLHLEVRDDGVGLRQERPVQEGVGLSNTRARLQHLYGPAHQFGLRNLEGGGLAVTLSFPLRRQPSPQASGSPPLPRGAGGGVQSVQ